MQLTKIILTNIYCLCNKLLQSTTDIYKFVFKNVLYNKWKFKIGTYIFSKISMYHYSPKIIIYAKYALWNSFFNLSWYEIYPG